MFPHLHAPALSGEIVRNSLGDMEKQVHEIMGKGSSENILDEPYH